MTQIFHNMIAAILGISEKQIGQTLSLLNDGATIPFISRYRKEITGGLDEVQIESIKTQYDKLSELAKRKETILGTIGEQGKLTAWSCGNASMPPGMPPLLKISTCPTSLNARPAPKPPARKDSNLWLCY